MCICASLPRVSVNAFFSNERCTLLLWTIIADWWRSGLSSASARKAATFEGKKQFAWTLAKQAPINVQCLFQVFSIHMQSTWSTCWWKLNFQDQSPEEMGYFNVFLGHFGERNSSEQIWYFDFLHSFLVIFWGGTVLRFPYPAGTSPFSGQNSKKINLKDP